MATRKNITLPHSQNIFPMVEKHKRRLYLPLKFTIIVTKAITLIKLLEPRLVTKFVKFIKFNSSNNYVNL